MRIVKLLIIFIFIATIFSQNVHAADNGNITLLSINPSIENPRVGEKVTFWILLTSVGKFWDVKIGIYFDFSLVKVKELPYIDGNVKIWFDMVMNESGEHNITVVADYLNEYNETNENDNEKSINITVSPKILPDLKIENIEISKEVIYEGDKITFNIYVECDNASSYNIPVAIYIDNEILDVKKIPWIPENETYILSVELIASSGNHIFSSLVNYGEEIEESNYTNNYGSVKFFVYPLNFTCNIEIMRAYGSESTAYYGESITAYAIIHNYARYPILHLKVGIYYDAHLIDIVEVPEISINGSYTLAHDITVFSNKSGENHTIMFFADYSNEYNETNENDNYGTFNITVDINNLNFVFSTGDIFLSTKNPIEGQEITIYGRIWNIGNTTGYAKSSLFVDNVTLGNFTVEIFPHRNTIIYSAWRCVGGWHNVGMIVNNEKISRLVWIEPAQIILSFLNNSLQFSNEHPYLNQSTWIYVKIENMGTATAKDIGIIFVEIQKTKEKIIGFEKITISSNSMGYLSINWSPDIAGNVTVECEFMPDSQFSFKNLNISKNVTVIEPLSDIAIENVSYRRVNYTAMLTIFIKNKGEIDAYNFILAVEVNGKLENETFITVLQAQNEIRREINITLQEGLNTVTVIADYTDVVKEHNESNNFYSFYIRAPVKGIPLPVLLSIIIGAIGLFILLSFLIEKIRYAIAFVFYSFIDFIFSIWNFLRGRIPVSEIRKGYEKFRYGR